MLTILLTSLAVAECPLQNVAIEPERQDITTADFSKLLAQSKGCTTVVELWASWCGPCVKIAPEVETFHKSHPDVLFLSVSADATGGAAEKFWRNHAPIGQKRRFSSWSMAELHTVYNSVGATFPEAIPYFIVLDDKGILQLEIHEPKNLSSLNETIDKLTNQDKP